MIVDRWEHGSEYHWLDQVPCAPIRHPWTAGSRLYGSGRDALTALVEMGRRERGWRRLWIPHYYCGEVTAAILCAGLECVLYPTSPLTGPPNLADLSFEKGDAVLLVNYFGLLAPVDVSADAVGVDIVEDHTHDPWSPWSRKSTADFCVASFRKVLPLPDGGVVWSPRGEQLPQEVEVTPEHEQAAGRKLMAMQLKRLYLDGHAVDREGFRALFMEGESAIGTGKMSGMTPFATALLRLLPVLEWRETRARNHRVLVDSLADLPGVRALKPENDEAVPFSVVLVFDSRDDRDRVRQELIHRSVYPAILWPPSENVAPPAGDAAATLAERVLSLHCDCRYSTADMGRVGELLRAASAENATSK